MVGGVNLYAREARGVEFAFEIIAARLGEFFVIGSAHIVEVAAVREVTPRAGHEPRALGQTGAPAPAHRVFAELAGLEIEHRRQLRAAWRN